MSRSSSFRFLWSTARLGVAFSLFLGFAVVASAQVSGGGPSSPMNPGAMPTPPGAGSSSDPSGSGTGAAPVLTTTGSGIKRSDVSSVVRVQALLYSDVVAVARINLTKIDYAGLNDFVAEIVDNGVGAIRSNDEYRVQLREYQKSAIKTSFTNLLIALQNAASRKFYQNKIDDVYIISYEKNGATVFAFPTDGLSEADQKTLIDFLAKEAEPFTIFNRFGFVVAVVEDADAPKADVDGIQAKYRALAARQRRQDAEANGSFGGFAPNASGVGPGASNDQKNDGEFDVASLPGVLRPKYLAEIDEAKRVRSESRRSVLPSVRRRFSKPASAEEAAKFFDALKQVDGAAFALVLDGAKGLAKLSEESRLGAVVEDDAAISDPSVLADSFAQSSTAFEADSDDIEFDANDAAPGLGVGFQAAQAAKAFLTDADVNPALENVQTISLAASLVGSPRIVAVVAFDAPQTALESADAFERSLAVAKPLVVEQATRFATEQNAENPDVLAPFIDGIFDAMNPQVVGNKVATTLDFNVFREKADALLPLFGGVEAKSAQESEADSIDWNLGAEESAVEDADVEAAEEETDDDFQDVDPETPEAPKAAPQEDEEDDPFA